MTFTEAAEVILRQVGKPLHFKKITQLSIEQNLLSHVGKTPETTMSTRLATLTKKDRGEASIIRVKPGVFALRVWGDVTAAAGEIEETDEAEASEGEEGEDAIEREPLPPPTEEEKARGELHAAGTALYPAEDDDDMPVMADKPPPPAPVKEAAAEGAAAAAGEGGRRRRRRRRRGRNGDRPEGAEGAEGAVNAAGEGEEGDEEGEEGEEGEGAESAELRADGEERAAIEGEEGESSSAEGAPVSASGEETSSPGEERREPRRDRERGRGRDRGDRAERGNRDDRGERNADRGERSAEGEERRPAVDGESRDEAGRDAADLLVSLLNRRDDRQGVPVRVLVDDGLRSGRLNGDPQVLSAALAAAARVDSARREAKGERPRLRIQGNRVSLLDWALGPELVRAESDALIAVERLRDAARRQLIRRINELPQPSFVELLVLLLERIGISSLRSVRRQGGPQGELALSGVARRHGEESRVAVLLKRGGEIGRERVVELRGSLHHFGPAQAAWVLTTGTVLSGAREEAMLPGIAPVTLLDGQTLARSLDENGVGVKHATVAIPYLDFDLFDALRG